MAASTYTQLWLKPTRNLKPVKKKGTKLSASRIAGKQQQLIEETGLGFVRENLAHYLTAPEPGTIEVVEVSAKTNGCQRKANDRNIYPAP